MGREVDIIVAGIEFMLGGRTAGASPVAGGDTEGVFETQCREGRRIVGRKRRAFKLVITILIILKIKVYRREACARAPADPPG